MHTKYGRVEADSGSKAGITKKTMIHKPVAWVSSTARLCLKMLNIIITINELHVVYVKKKQ